MSSNFPEILEGGAVVFVEHRRAAIRSCFHSTFVRSPRILAELTERGSGAYCVERCSGKILTRTPVEAPEGSVAEHHTTARRGRGQSVHGFVFPLARCCLIACLWYRRQAGLVEDGGAQYRARERPVAAPAPAAAQTTSQSTNVRGTQSRGLLDAPGAHRPARASSDDQHHRHQRERSRPLSRPWSNGEWNEWARRDE